MARTILQNGRTTHLFDMSQRSTVGEDVSPRIGADVRITRDGSMMASMVDRTAMSHEPAEWYRENPSSDLLQVMSLIRHRLQQRSILLIDFLCLYDTLKSGGRNHQMHTGYITRGVDSCGCLGDLSATSFEALADAFTEQRSVPEYRDRDINYEALCEVLQGVSHHSNNFRTGALVLPERYRVMYDQLRDPNYKSAFNKIHSKLWVLHEGDDHVLWQSFDDLPLARQPLSRQGERRFESLKRAVMHTIFADRISARELLGDFDAYLNASVAWMKKGSSRTPMINMSAGCISRSQFLRGMHRLAGRMDLTEEDLNLIFNKYKKNGAFNYYAFCRDVDPGFEELQDSFEPASTEERP